MSTFAEFFFLVYTFGPAAAIPYGLAFIDPASIFIILLVCYTVPVPLILYGLTKFFEKEDYRSRLINEAVFLTKKKMFELRKMSDQIIKTFNDWWGDLGYDLALAVIAFLLGFIIAAFVGFIMRLPKRRAFIAIFFGNLFGVIFWFAVAVGTIHIFNTTFFILLMLFISFYSYVYARARERRIIPIIVEKVEKQFKKEEKRKSIFS